MSELDTMAVENILRKAQTIQSGLAAAKEHWQGLLNIQAAIDPGCREFSLLEDQYLTIEEAIEECQMLVQSLTAVLNPITPDEIGLEN